MIKGQLLTRLFIYLLCAVFLFSLIKPIVDKDKHKSTLIADASLKVLPKAEIEQPLHNVTLPDFAKIRDVKTKKKQFFDFLRPAVNAENIRIKRLRAQLSFILLKLNNFEVLSSSDEILLNRLAKKYKVKPSLLPLDKATELFVKIDIIPSALTLVQAANESAWGTSRFARIGLNFFGIWCFQKGCGMVPKGRDVGLNHEVSAFSSIDNAVKYYLHNINTNRSYNVFRTIRAQLRQHNQTLSPKILAAGLLPYSERGTDYVLEITKMLRHNQEYLLK